MARSAISIYPLSRWSLTLFPIIPTNNQIQIALCDTIPYIVLWVFVYENNIQRANQLKLGLNCVLAPQCGVAIMPSTQQQ